LFSSIDFGGGALTSAGYADIYVAKLDADGNHLWSNSFGTTQAEYGFCVTADSHDNVVMSGYFDNSVDFGGGVLTSAGGDEVFVVKFDPAGNHLWSKRFGDASAQHNQYVSVDRWDNVLLTGQFYGTIDFGGGALTSAGNNDIYVAKFDAAGNHIWSQGWGDAAKQYGHCITTDGSGNVFLVGEFQGSVDFGGGALASGGDYDAFVAMFDAGGSHIWSRGFGDATHQRAVSAAVDGAGNVVIIGDFQGVIDPGGGVLTSAGSDDVFTAKYDAAGNHLWSRRSGDASSQIGECVAIDNSASIFATGFFSREYRPRGRCIK
jgi:hypothetical protein